MLFSQKSIWANEKIHIPQYSGYINDYAHVFSQETTTKMQQLLQTIETKTSIEIAVATIETTSPLEIESYAVKLFEKWGIGKKGKDNGVLIIVAVKDRKIRIEVGYGLEGVLTDIKSKLIIEDIIVPYFKKGLYDLGVYSALLMITKIFQEEYGIQFNIDSQISTLNKMKRKKSPLGSFATFLFFILIFGFRFGSLFFFMGRGGSYWSGGGRSSFGGGFGGFGGGMSGGGGSSGSW